jgi:hypothetical protein
MSENYLKQATDLAQAHRVSTEKVLNELHQVLKHCLKFDPFYEKSNIEEKMLDCNSDLIKINNKLCDLYTMHCFRAFGINISFCQNNDLSIDTYESSASGQSLEFEDASDLSVVVKIASDGLSAKDKNDVKKSF